MRGYSVSMQQRLLQKQAEEEMEKREAERRRKEELNLKRIQEQIKKQHEEKQQRLNEEKKFSMHCFLVSHHWTHFSGKGRRRNGNSSRRRLSECEKTEGNPLKSFQTLQPSPDWRRNKFIRFSSSLKLFGWRWKNLALGLIYCSMEGRSGLEFGQENLPVEAGSAQANALHPSAKLGS